MVDALCLVVEVAGFEIIRHRRQVCIIGLCNVGHVDEQCGAGVKVLSEQVEIRQPEFGFQVSEYKSVGYDSVAHGAAQVKGTSQAILAEA